MIWSSSERMVSGYTRMLTLNFIIMLVTAGLVGAVVGAIQNQVQGDDVEKSAKGGFAAGIATAIFSYVAYLSGTALT
jgi:hypothetical protein